MGQPFAWVLNLDAEDELARGRPGHTRSAAMTARIEKLRSALTGLLRPEDVWLSEGHQLLEPGRYAGRAWCPTPSALALMARAGVASPEAPPLSVLRRVNHRRFSAELGQTLPAARFVEDPRELFELLSAPGRQAWLLKRPLGFAGRGRRIIRGAAFTAAEERWIAASFRGGEGLQVEPLAERVQDFGLHGYLELHGRLHQGRPTVQTCDALGAWLTTRLAEAGDLSAGEEAALRFELSRTGAALHQAGYFGPFGLDAFRFVGVGGALELQPRSEINARYSMGWAIGMEGFVPPRGLP